VIQIHLGLVADVFEIVRDGEAMTGREEKKVLREADSAMK
jgi:hypothetical protein